MQQTIKRYNLADLQRDLATLNIEEERKRPEVKAFRVFDNLNKYDAFIKHHKKSATQTLAEYVSSYNRTDKANEIDLRFFRNYPITVFTYDNPEEIFLEELTEEETNEINAVFNCLIEFNKKNSKNFYYMVEYGNGYTEETASVYNFLQEYTRNKFSYLLKDLTPNKETIIKWLKEIYPYYFDFVNDDIRREKELIKEDETFINSFINIFNYSLHFNIDLTLNHEKAGGLNEQRAIKIVNKIGQYNEFNPRKFNRIITYLNTYFLANYGAGNCNNHKKDYTLFLGREGSPVIYIEAYFKSKDEITATIDELSELVRPDEISTERQFEVWDGKQFARLRLWWD